ncbi:MAG TPA: discoidin domain-containing protein [Brevundimonas sp.]
MMRFAAFLIALLLAFPVTAQEARILDGFETLTPWTADASTDVSSAISAVDGHDGRAMRLTYDFNGKSGYAFAARALPLRIPENWEISFWIRGQGPSNTLEIKFVDASGDNVHWRQVRGFTAPDGWTRFVIKKRQVTRAWGPNPDPTFRGAERMEFVVTAGEGGAGFIEVDGLELRELPPEPSVPPRPVATATAANGNDVAARAVDGDAATSWKAPAGAQSLTLDLGYEREFGGLTLRWVNGAAATDYRVMASSDGREWRALTAVAGGDGGTDWLRTPEASARWLRLDLTAGQGATYALNEIEIEPLSFGETPTKFIEAVAQESRRGLYPRGFFGEQPYWTLVGVDGGGESGLMGEDGAIELRRGGPSIEPFVIENGRLVTWADVDIDQSLRDGDLPIPSVTWTADEWTLKVTSFAQDGRGSDARLYGHYALTNTSARSQTLSLALMVRPMQVNGPVQFLAVPGGVAPISKLVQDGVDLAINDRIGVSFIAPPDRIEMSSFEAGADPQALLAQPRSRESVSRLEDASGLAAGASIYDVTLAPGETRDFGFISSLPDTLRFFGTPYAGSWDLGAMEGDTAGAWRAKLDRVDLILPPEAQRIEDVMRSSLAHMLMSRQGPVLQPGTRSYNRSWIRDGAMMAEGLNRLGHADLSADYLRFYAPFVFENGKVPCCVDQRGADPVPENDSHGEFIFLAAETYRYTHDEALLRAVWPQVEKAVGYMDALRASTRTAEFQTPQTAHLFGLLPPTISHEGYSDKPAYSYWDDFWGLLGYRDAVFIAETLGETEAAARFRAGEREFTADFMRSVETSAAFHGIDWINGAADRGDFDATSTTIGLSPGGTIDELPRELLARTFDKYWENFEARLGNREAWDAYTPYELRVVGAFVRLGQRERALQALDFFFADVRPRAWNGWAEVVGRELRKPVFVGDMPHAWISSDYIRSALDLFAYERDRDHALVLAAGAPISWIDSETGVGVRGLRTAYGPLSYLLKREDVAYVLSIEPGATPPGGFVLQWPDDAARPTEVRIDGRRVADWTGGDLVIPATARRVVLR